MTLNDIGTLLWNQMGFVPQLSDMLEDGRTDQSSAYGTLLDGEPGDPCTCPRWGLSVLGMSLTQGHLCEYDLREGSFFVVPRFSLTHSVLEEMECMT